MTFDIAWARPTLPDSNDIRGIKEVAELCSTKANLEERLGELLGCGEQGCAYSVTGNSNIVIKVTPLMTGADMWVSEATIGCELGDLGIAPKIYRTFRCSSYGFIVMDRLIDASKIPVAGGHIDIREYDPRCDRRAQSWKSGCPKYDHLSRMSNAIQSSFISVFALAIERGFLHMDNHIENIGFLSGLRPCLFDFGFTQRRVLSGRDAEMALAFSIGQVLEHCPVPEMEGTAFFSEFCRLVGLPGTLEALQSNFAVSSKKDAEAIIKQIKKDRRPFNNADVYVGTLCYCYFLTLPLETRTNSSNKGLPFINEIYNIRQNKFF